MSDRHGPQNEQQIQFRCTGKFLRYFSKSNACLNAKALFTKTHRGGISLPSEIKVTTLRRHFNAIIIFIVLYIRMHASWNESRSGADGNE